MGILAGKAEVASFYWAGTASGIANQAIYQVNYSEGSSGGSAVVAEVGNLFSGSLRDFQVVPLTPEFSDYGQGAMVFVSTTDGTWLFQQGSPSNFQQLYSPSGTQNQISVRPIITEASIVQWSVYYTSWQSNTFSDNDYQVSHLTPTATPDPDAWFGDWENTMLFTETYWSGSIGGLVMLPDDTLIWSYNPDNDAPQILRYSNGVNQVIGETPDVEGNTPYDFVFDPTSGVTYFTDTKRVYSISPDTLSIDLHFDSTLYPEEFPFQIQALALDPGGALYFSTFNEIWYLALEEGPGPFFYQVQTVEENIDYFQVVSVPEPSVTSLLGLVIGGFVWLRFLRRRGRQGFR